MTNECKIDTNGDKRCYNSKGKLHREDDPAVEYINGFKIWYLNGKCHRLDGPAIEWPDGTKWWYKNGELHREDGPAVEYIDGSNSWYINGKEYTHSDWLTEIRKKKFASL